MKYLFFIFTFFIALVQPLKAGAHIEDESLIKVEWEAPFDDKSLFATQIGDLYVALYNVDSLPVTSSLVGKRKTPLDVISSSESYFSNKLISVSFESLLCDLNPKHCKRKLVKVSPDKFEDLKSHVGGFLPSSSSWTIGPNDSLTFPLFNLQTFTTLKRVSKPLNWNVDTYEPSPLFDCSAWKTSCKSVVERFNPKNIIDSIAPSRVTLPSFSVKVPIVFSVHPNSYLGVLLGNDEYRPSNYFDINTTASEEWNNYLLTERKSPINNFISQFNDMIVSVVIY